MVNCYAGVDSMLYAVQLSSLNDLTIYGPKPSRGRAALCSFNVKGLHATDISTLLDQEGVLLFFLCIDSCLRAVHAVGHTRLDSDLPDSSRIQLVYLCLAKRMLVVLKGLTRYHSTCA